MAEVLKLGVFFDGTGNHKKNDIRIGDGSISNIGKLFELYDVPDTQKFYREGVGTRNLTNDEIEQVKSGQAKKNDFYDDQDMSLGMGMKDKIEEMLEYVNKFIKDHPNEKIVIDTFGFSRGAASARDFINEINKLYANNPNVEIGFVGLFDTVASEGLANKYNLDLNMNLNENSAKNIFQITALDEFRSNFPLESLYDKRGNLPSNFKEISLFGAHSDIGGGYLKLYKEYFEKESGSFFYVDDMDKANKLTALVTKNKDTTFFIEGESATNELMYTLASIRKVDNSLSNVSLNLMMQEAIKSGITFTTNPDINTTIPKDLQDYYNAILEGKDISPYKQQVKKYIHISASNGKANATWRDTLAHFKDIDGVRDVYKNKPFMAILPSELDAMVDVVNSAKEFIGLDKLEELSYKVIEEFETNKEEKQKNIQEIIDNIKYQPTIDLKIQTLQNSTFLSNFEDKHCHELIKQYHDKVIENRCNAVSNIDFLNMDISYDTNHTKKLELKEENTKEKEPYSFSSYSQNQTLQPSVQMIQQ
jgi:hypothetical protein